MKDIKRSGVIFMNGKETTASTSTNGLVTLLQSNTKDVMMNIADKHTIKVYKSHTKTKMAESMKEKMLENLPHLLSSMDNNSQGTLKKVLSFKENETIFDVLDAKPLAALAEYGYLYVEEADGEFQPFLADEVKEIVESLEDNEEYTVEAAKYQEFSMYVTALLHLYGMYTVEQFVKVWNEHHSEAITEESASEFITHLADWDIQFIFNENLITSVLFDAEGIEQESLKRILHIAYFMPTKEDVQYYEDHWINADSLQYLNMKNFLARKEFGEDTKNIALYTIVEGAVIGKSGEKLYQDLTKRGFSFDSKEEVMEFVELFKELREHSRTWHNHGFTIQELASSKMVQSANLKPVKQPVTVHKVGRNDPCPCGSGKKYKKCHGK